MLLENQRKCSYQECLDELQRKKISKPHADGPAFYRSLGIKFFSDATKRRHKSGECSCVQTSDSEYIQWALSQKIEKRVLLFDFERINGVSRKDFWSRADLKNAYIFLEDVVEEPKVTMVAWKWLGEDEVHVKSIWDFDSEEDFAKFWYEVQVKADTIIAHSGKYADFPWAKETFWWHNQLPPLPRQQLIDTKDLATEAAMPFKKLQDLAVRFGYEGKDGYYSKTRMRKAIDGDKEAREYLESYNSADVVALEQVFWYLAQRSQKPLRLNPIKQSLMDLCDKCLDSDLEKVGYITPAKQTFVLYQCRNCKSFHQANKPVKVKL